MQSQSIQGECRVICFSPDHSKTLSHMDEKDILSVVQTWQQHIDELSSTYPYVQLFENKGEMMGCSNPHPHSQIWASTAIPTEIARESANQKAYFDKHQRPLLIDYLDHERTNQERIVYENDEWAVLVPFWAVWPYETMLLPKKHIAQFTDLSPKQMQSLSQAMKKLLVACDTLFHTRFPYTMGWHFAPHANESKKYWQFHAHYYPPLLRSATIRKYLVGYEMLAEAQRDITPEEAAAKIRKAIV